MTGRDHRSTSLIVLLVLVSVSLCLAKWWLDDVFEAQFRTSSIETSRADLQRQILDVRKGDTTFVRLYETVETDSLLKELHQATDIRDSIQALWLGMTDISDSGVAAVRELHGLTRLHIYGGVPSISNIGLSNLAGHPVLRDLRLVDTRVTPEGLSPLVDVPNLRVLFLATRHTHANRNDGFDVLDVVQSIGRLQQIEELHLDGIWSDLEVVRQLRELLPHVVITTGYEDAGVVPRPMDDQGH